MTQSSPCDMDLFVIYLLCNRVATCKQHMWGHCLQSCDMRTFSGPEEFILSVEREKAWEAWCNSHSVGQTCLKFLNAQQPLWELQAEKAIFHRNNDDAGVCVAYWVIPRVHIHAFLLTHGPSYLHFSIIKPSFRRPIFRFFFPIFKWRNLPYGNTSIVFTHTCLADNNG